MKHNILFIATFCLLLFTACEKVIEFNGEQTKPLLVVNGIQRQGKPACVSVSRSQFFLSSDNNYSVNNVNVNLYINGQFIETLQHKIDTIDGCWNNETLDIYCGTHELEAGDSVRFEVSAPNFTTAKAGTIIPNIPFIISFDTTRAEITTFGDVYDDYPYNDFDQYGNPCCIRELFGDTIWPNDIRVGSFYFNLKFSDPANQVNYYNLSMIDGFTNPFSSDFVFTTDNIDALSQVSSAFEDESDCYLRTVNPFRDIYFSGKEYDLSFYESTNYNFYNESSVKFTIGLSNVDYNYYQYVRTYNQADENDGFGSLIGMFREPTQVYSNVDGGLGIVCSESAVSKRSIVIYRRRN